MFFFNRLIRAALLGAVIFHALGASVWASSVVAGTTATMVAASDGTPPFFYQWQKEGKDIDGATAERYLLKNVQISDAGTYTVIVGNSGGSIKSTPAVLTVVIADTVVTLSAAVPQIVTLGHDVSFTVTDTTGPGQWQSSSNGGSTWGNLSNNTYYRGVTDSTLVIANVPSALNGYLYRFVTSSGVSSTMSLSVAEAVFPFPVGVTADSAGNIYVSDTSTNTVQKISSGSTVTLLAGLNGQAGGTDGNGSNARFNSPSGVSSTSEGIVFVGDNSNGTVRRISPDGTVTTLAGSLTKRGNNDGQGSVATFSSPIAIAQDASGNLYVADALNNTVRKITSTGTVSTLAGKAGVSGWLDDKGANALFNHPTGITVDRAGTVYVADTMNNVIRKITPEGVVSTLAGLVGVSGSQDGVGNGALFNNPSGITVDGSGTVYLADTGNSTIRKVAPNGLVWTLAGLPGIAGLKDGVGTNAWFNQPKGLALDSTGNLCVTDTGNAAIRKVSLAGVVSTLALSVAPNVVNYSPAAVTETPSVITTPPAVTAPPAVTTSVAISQASPSGSGGGGGGGAMGGWFSAALLVMSVFRWCFPRATKLNVSS